MSRVMMQRLMMLVPFTAWLTLSGWLGAENNPAPKFKFDPNSKGLSIGEGDRWQVPVSYTHLTLPTIYSV